MFLWPPRPENAIPREFIPMYESMGYIAQIKKNGTCCVMDVDADGETTFWNRHNEHQKAWRAPENIKDYFSDFPNSVIVGELLHNKHPGFKNIIYIFDVLILHGKELYGTTLNERLTILKDFPTTEGIWIAETFTQNLQELFDGLISEIDEGIVLKDPEATLAAPFRQSINADWQVKCRKPTKLRAF